MQSSIGIKGKVKLTFENIQTGEVEVLEYDNLFVTAGKVSIAKRMSGVDTNSMGQVTYMAVGTTNTAANIADTTLVTEIFRKQISTRSYSTTSAAFRTFFNTDEANGVLTEVGLFGDDASSTADSGTLYARRVISRTKTSSETLTIDWTLTVT